MEFLNAISSHTLLLYERSCHPGAPEQRQAHFRSMSPSQPSFLASAAPPQTGLGLLMTAKNGSAPPHTLHAMSAISPAQQLLIQEDLADRERQASSLAAAGMVAESVSLTRPVGGAFVQGNKKPPQGLQAPPVLGMVPPPASNGNVEMDAINWNLLDLGNTNLDDLDMDFATLFDPANEVANASIQAQGGVWAPGVQPEAPAAPAAPVAVHSLPSIPHPPRDAPL
jgi:hypothetical protein